MLLSLVKLTMLTLRSLSRSVGRQSLTCERRIVTSASNNTLTGVKISFMPTNSRDLQQSDTSFHSNRLNQLTKHFTTTTSKAAEYNMASDNPSAHNNPDFQLAEIFGVKDKVALVTGKRHFMAVSILH